MGVLYYMVIGWVRGIPSRCFALTGCVYGKPICLSKIEANNLRLGSGNASRCFVGAIDNASDR